MPSYGSATLKQNIKSETLIIPNFQTIFRKSKHKHNFLYNPIEKTSFGTLVRTSIFNINNIDNQNAIKMSGEISG